MAAATTTATTTTAALLPATAAAKAPRPRQTAAPPAPPPAPLALGPPAGRQERDRDRGAAPVLLVPRSSAAGSFRRSSDRSGNAPSSAFASASAALSSLAAATLRGRRLRLLYYCLSSGSRPRAASALDWIAAAATCCGPAAAAALSESGGGFDWSLPALPALARVAVAAGGGCAPPSGKGKAAAAAPSRWDHPDPGRRPTAALVINAAAAVLGNAPAAAASGALADEAPVVPCCSATPPPRLSLPPALACSAVRVAAAVVSRVDATPAARSEAFGDSSLAALVALAGREGGRAKRGGRGKERTTAEGSRGRCCCACSRSRGSASWQRFVFSAARPRGPNGPRGRWQGCGPSTSGGTSACACRSFLSSGEEEGEARRAQGGGGAPAAASARSRCSERWPLRSPRPSLPRRPPARFFPFCRRRCTAGWPRRRSPRRPRARRPATPPLLLRLLRLSRSCSGASLLRARRLPTPPRRRCLLASLAALPPPLSRNALSRGVQAKGCPAARHAALVATAAAARGALPLLSALDERRVVRRR